MAPSLTESRIQSNRATTYGIVAIVLGVLSILAPVFTGLSVMFILGGIVLVAGIVRIVLAMEAGNFSKGLPGFVIGGLTAICGILLLVNPLFASGVLTILLVLYFICDGIFEVVVGILRRPNEGWKWLLFGGIVSIILGIIILNQYPVSGAWALGIFLGIKLFSIGVNMLTERPAL